MGLEISNLPLNADGSLFMGGSHGKYYEAASKGRVFIQTTTPLGLAIPIYTATAPRIALFNPKGSGRNAVLLRLAANRASGVTVAFTAGFMRVVNVGATAATGAPVTVFGQTDPFNALVGGGQASHMLSTASGTVTTTAGVAGDFFYSLFHSYAGVDASAINDNPIVHDFDGAVIVPPGVMVWLAASVASVALYATSLMWEEVDITSASSF